MALAKYPGTCTRCGGPFDTGDRIMFFNRPRPRSPYHAQCPDGSGPSTETPATSSARGDLAAAIAEAIAPHIDLPEPAPTVDEDTVRRIVTEVIEARVPQVVTIEVKRPDGATATVDGAHYMMPRLLRLLGAGIHCYLWGPAGTGKTTAALQAAHALGKLDSEIDTLDPSTPKSAIMGYRTPAGDPVETAYTRCYTRGQVYVGDEVDNAPAHVQSIKNSSLANGHAPTAWGMVPRGDGFVYVGTGNTPGRPTAAFPDRRPMSAAFADRLYFIHWPLDPAIECRAAGIQPPAPPARVERTCTPAEWVRWVQRVREWAATNAPTLMVTPRASLTGLQALAVGETPEEVAHGLVFRGADAALVQKTLAAVPLP